LSTQPDAAEVYGHSLTRAVIRYDGPYGRGSILPAETQSPNRSKPDSKVSCVIPHGDLEGFESALVRKKRATPPTPKLLDGAGEAKLIAMRLGKPPAGYGHWTLRLLADQLVELEVVDSIGRETVRQTLKKMA
jgi:hypothetical protein